MGDVDNMYQYIYEGNLVPTGAQVPAPATLVLLALGLAGLRVAGRTA